jgi:hypothetical protein
MKVVYNVEFGVLAIDHGYGLEFYIENWPEDWFLGGTWIKIGDFD